MSDAAVLAAEESMTALVGASYMGATTAPEPEPEVEKFEFDGEFQTKVAAHVLRDYGFMRRTAHLIDPAHFESAGEAAIVNMAKRFWDKFQTVPPKNVLTQLIKDDITNNVIRGDTQKEAILAMRQMLNEDVSGGEYVSEMVSEFARHQAMSQAILASVDHLGKKKFDKIEKAVKDALAIGTSDDGDSYDYYERVAERTEVRLDKAAGKLPPTGITTGHPKLDELLYHRGWGRRELTTIMGGAKTGKTTALIGFAKGASLAGHNVLYATLEVATSIISDRLDAAMSDNMMKEIGKNIHDIDSKIRALHAKAGCIKIHEYPAGTLTPGRLTALIERYESKGIIFDLVVVDYGDIMAPDHRYNDPIENSKSIYIGLRAIASEKNVAVLTATQTNREGFKANIAKAEHAAEDFNKVRIVDLMISININDEERANGEARLYFAASRNQESGFTVFIKSDISRMKFITAILRVE